MNGRCLEYREKIAELLAGDPSGGDADAVERHLRECPECRRYQEVLLQDDEMLTAYVRSAEETVTRLEGMAVEAITSEKNANYVSPAPTGARWGPRVFRSRTMKFAAAAVVILGIIAVANLFDGTGGSDVVWADVMRQVEQAQDFICRVQQENSDDPDLEMVQYRSQKYGYRMDMYRDGRLVAAQYFKPSSELLYVIVHRDRTYAVVELSEEQREQMLSESNAQSLVDYFRSFEFEELGRKKIDGAVASGIEVVDPEPMKAVFDESSVRLWVDVETNWPVRIEWEGVAKRGRVRVETVLDRFQWNPSLSADDFEFEIPDDYQLIGRMDAPRKDERSAIEGLREYAGFTGGRYPSALSLATALHEVEDELGRRRGGGRLSKGDFGDLMKIQNACGLYVDLVEADKDAAYYGDVVGIRDFDRVLLRWRLDDGQYRVIYGDLRAETVSPERLAELEGRSRR